MSAHARQREGPAEDAPPGEPDILGKRAHRADPAAEALAQRQGEHQRRAQDDHAGRVPRVPRAGRQPELERHQRADRQEALGGDRLRDGRDAPTSSSDAKRQRSKPPQSTSRKTGPLHRRAQAPDDGRTSELPAPRRRGRRRSRLISRQKHGTRGRVRPRIDRRQPQESPALGNPRLSCGRPGRAYVLGKPAEERTMKHALRRNCPVRPDSDGPVCSRAAARTGAAASPRNSAASATATGTRTR